jgi:peptidyl-dipeptidase Dcp
LAKAEIDFVKNEEAPTFKTPLKLWTLVVTLDRLSSIFFNLNSAETNDEIQNRSGVSPLLSDFGNDIRLNANYLLKLKQYMNKSSFEPQQEQTTLLDEKYKSFSRNGANLRRIKKTNYVKLTKNYQRQVYSLAKMY